MRIGKQKLLKKKEKKKKNQLQRLCKSANNWAVIWINYVEDKCFWWQIIHICFSPDTKLDGGETGRCERKNISGEGTKK